MEAAPQLVKELPFSSSENGGFVINWDEYGHEYCANDMTYGKRFDRRKAQASKRRPVPFSYPSRYLRSIS